MELTDSAILDIRRNHFSGNQLQLALEPPSDDWHAWMLELREQHPWSPGFHDWWQRARAHLDTDHG